MTLPFHFGVDYYPEQIQSDQWAYDARLMHEAGFNLVRLAEFAWSALEPVEGQYDFAWLDHAIEILSAQGLRIVLGTPSASVPPWLFEAHPDMAIVNEHGITRTYGSRRDASPTHPAYRDYAVRIARAMAQHYADHSHVIGWQIDNEFGDRCYSEGSRRAFQRWLREKYGSLAELNRTWGTAFWSHVYTAWEQIPVPRVTTHARHNPGLHLDYLRFISHQYAEFQQLQIDALRQYIPDHHFITHNLMGFSYGNLDYFEVSHALDFVSWDNYPSAFWREPQIAEAAVVAMGHSAMWGLKQQNFWVMEQQSGPSGWHIISPSPRPGQIALWAYQAIAHGADGIVFFRWRTNPQGAEQNWHGILDPDGVPRRRFREIQTMGQQLKRVADYIVGSQVKAQVAILHDYDTRFSFQIQPDNGNFSYEHHLYEYYRALHNQGVGTALISGETDLSTYSLVIAPALRLVDPATVLRLETYVENGGILVLTMRSGSRDKTNALVIQPPPGLLTKLTGVMVEEYDSLPPGAMCSLHFNAPLIGNGHATVWCDVLSPTHAQSLCDYKDGYYAGTPTVTLNRYGAGAVLYVGTHGDRALIESIVSFATELAAVVPPLPLNGSKGIEVTERWDGNQRMVFVLNHFEEPATLPLTRICCDLLTGETFDTSLPLSPYQVRILQDI